MFGAIAGGIASALAGGAMSKLFGGGQKAASGGIQGDVLATDNNTVGMGDAGIKSAIQGSNVPNPDEAVPSFVSGAIDRKSGSAGMPRPSSYAVFCLKKKRSSFIHRSPQISRQGQNGQYSQRFGYVSFGRFAVIFFIRLRPRPKSTLFPYTTLFRSCYR